MDAADPDPAPDPQSADPQPDAQPRETPGAAGPSDSEPSSSLPAVRNWPPHEQLDDDTALTAQCTGCGAPWRIHPDMAGFKLRCSCGTYVAVPRLPAPASTDALVPSDEPRDIMLAPEITEDDQGRLELSSKPGEVLDREMPITAPMAPGTVKKGNVTTQQRWTNIAFLELALMMAAFLVPQLAISLIFDGQARTLAMPFASLITGIAVVLIAAGLSPFAFSGMRRTEGRYYVEAVLVAGLTFVLAMGWMHLVDVNDEGGAMMRAWRSALGTGWFLFVLSFTPAVFEEIAFRGVLQGRFYALLGRFQGVIATGTAFGICHGITAALPFHVGIGIYLCWLRERSASLWPCMLMHGVYNATIGLTA